MKLATKVDDITAQSLQTCNVLLGAWHYYLKEGVCCRITAAGRAFYSPAGFLMTGFAMHGCISVRCTLLCRTTEAMETVGEPPMIDHYAAPWVGTAQYELRSDARR